MADLERTERHRMQEEQKRLAEERNELEREYEEIAANARPSSSKTSPPRWSSLTPEYEKQTEELGAHLDLYKRLIAEGYEHEAEELKKSVEAMKERKRLAARAEDSTRSEVPPPAGKAAP